MPQPTPGEPRSAEYVLVDQLISQTLASGKLYNSELVLENTEAGKAIIQSTPEELVQIVLALVTNIHHFQRSGKDLVERRQDLEPTREAEWQRAFQIVRICEAALRRVMLRKLPFSREQLIAIAGHIASVDPLGRGVLPLTSFVKAFEANGPIHSSDAAFYPALSCLVKSLREGYGIEVKLADRIDRLLVREETGSNDSSGPQTLEPDASAPLAVGSPEVLLSLKKFLGLPAAESDIVQVVGYDQFPLRADSPFLAEHEAISLLLPGLVERPGYQEPDLTKSPVGQAMLTSDSIGKGRLVMAVTERCANAKLQRGYGADHRIWQSHYAFAGMLQQMLAAEYTLQRNDLFDLLLYFSVLNEYLWVQYQKAGLKLIDQVERLATSSPLTPGERHVLYRLRAQIVRAAPFGRPAEDVARIDRLLRDGLFMALVPGEAWSDVVNAELTKMAGASRQNWVELLKHATTATAARPSAKWLKQANALLAKVGQEAFRTSLLRWFPLTNKPRTLPRLPETYMSEPTFHVDNANCLRGLLWMSNEVATPDLIRAVGALTVSCYRKVPGIGPRAVKVGNAGVYALSQINDNLAVGQLALLKIKVKFGSAQKEIEKAFAVAAERSGLPQEELEEMSVPTYGLTDVGVCEEQLGNFTARLTITGTDSTELIWVKPDGKVQSGVPAEVKASHTDDLKELQAAAKDIQKMLPAQRDRIDSLFLQDKKWPIRIWRERYLDHPLIGTLARRILWEFEDGARITAGIWFQGQLVDYDLKPLDLSPDTKVRLWHPIGKALEEIAGWRAWLDAQQIQQPFKQAHREIYLLTDAERRTGTYSNRYAAHILKQHQFNALCALRGWKNQLRLAVDADYCPPFLRLPQWNLFAEFWVEAIAQDIGSGTNESGVYLYLTTDQVRFYRSDAAGDRPGNAEPLSLDQIPPLVFSEVMRDVDLFVGVASVGNDPSWADGGTDGHRAYWQSFSFGDLSASAKTRKDVLQRLVPRLKIAKQCSFDEKFLVIKGNLRTYKIHLGSGNILMEPNDQYLCIVPKQSVTEDGKVLLPFEGDRTLSVIISKAFLLAEDTKIKDPSIVSQIKR